MAFVIDASVAVAWALAEDHGHGEDEEDGNDGNFALERLRGEEARVPALWWFEVRNALLVNERRGRIAPADTALFLRSLLRLAVTFDPLPREAEVLALARRHRLTVYDAAYLDLAQKEGLPLATLDSDLKRAARRERVPLIAGTSTPPL